MCCACVGVCSSVAMRRKNCTVDPQVCYKGIIALLTVPFFLWGGDDRVHQLYFCEPEYGPCLIFFSFSILVYFLVPHVL